MELRNGILGLAEGQIPSEMALGLQQPRQVWILSEQVTARVECIGLTFLGYDMDGSGGKTEG